MDGARAGHRPDRVRRRRRPSSTKSDGFRGAFDYTRVTRARLYLAWQAGVSYLRAAPRGRPARSCRCRASATSAGAFEAMPDPAGRVPAVLAVACTDGLFEIQGASARRRSARRRRHVPRGVAAPIARGSDTPLGRPVRRAGVVPLGGRPLDRRRACGRRRTEQIRIAARERRRIALGRDHRPGVVRVSFAPPGAGCLARPERRSRALRAERRAARAGCGRAPIGGELYFAPWGARDRELRRARSTQRPAAFVTDTDLERAAVRSAARGASAWPKGRTARSWRTSAAARAVLSQDRRWSVVGRRRRFQPVRTDADGLRRRRPDGVVWFGWKRQFVRFDLARSAAAAMPPFPVLVRRVTAGPGSRAVRRRARPLRAAAAASTTDALRFEFAAPTFLIDETATEYQTRLDGLDADWSAWTTRDAPRLHQPADSATTASTSARATSPGR